MPLKFPAEWRFESGPNTPKVPPDLVSELHTLAIDIANQHEFPKSIIESFKARFGSPSISSSTDWAISDLDSAMTEKSPNAPAFIASFWQGLEDAQAEQLDIPTPKQVNAILRKHKVPFEIRPPKIIATDESLIFDTNESKTTDNQDGQSIHAYKLGERIGQGGFGSVYIATRKTSIGEFEFAIKILDPSPLGENDPEKLRIRFRREIKSIQKLQHRGIVPYFDAGLDPGGRPYLVMPRIHGKNIRDAAMSKPFRTRVKLMSDVLLAVDYAHQNKVLHRDIKPSNIIVRSSDEQPIIVDFGASYILDNLDRESITTRNIGSQGYIPPEVIALPKTRNTLHDIYSCAVITYEIISGQLPNPIEYRPLALINPGLELLDPVLIRALGPSSKRHQSALDLREHLNSVIKKLEV
ncbi:serine/threonine-protein kinase [Corallococcus sp. EGB]|uniref:serine/threonine protein kinase n=1 Tax=Corallococcus sp. EGB TaxID=1521117 RepID=UPI001CBC402D|nr:serine/threonine-protein kinase [Corallococcus sp. EGB]